MTSEEHNNNQQYKCPHCACIFLNKADLQKHLNRFGDAKGEHEFIYRTPSPPEIRRTIEGEICGGVRFDTAQEWTELYEAAGLRDARLARSTQGSTNRAS